MTSITLENIGSFIAEQGLDTLVLSKFFQQSNFSQEQAEAIAEVFSKIPLASEKTFEKRIENFSEQNSKNLECLVNKGDLMTAQREIELKLELKIAEVHVEIEKVKSDLIKWVAGLMIANTGLLFTLIKFFN